MIESGLFALLTQAPQLIQPQNGTNGPLLTANGVYFSLMPKGSPVPAVVMTRVSSPSEAITLDGTTSDTRGRFQFECFGEDNTGAVTVSSSGYLCAAALSLGIRKLLQDLSLNTEQTPLPDGTVVTQSAVVDEFDAPYQVGGTGYLYRRVLDLYIWFQE